jgi:hypothetical protein
LVGKEYSLNLQELTTLASHGEILELELLSLQGGVYIARVRLAEGLLTLMDERAQPLRLRSVTHLRELLPLAPPFPCVLVQQCAHDEMCGVRNGEVEALRIGFSLTAPW